MAERKIATVVAMLFLVVVVALVPVATADACTDECYKDCGKGKKEDVPSCTKTCDGMCGLKAATRAYAAATPAAKAAIVDIFDKEPTTAGSAAAASTPGFGKLKAGCLRECNKNNQCHGAGKKDCNTGCDNFCRRETERLSTAAAAYGKAPAAEKAAVDQAIDKGASGLNDNAKTFAASCIRQCSKFCDKDPACLAICNNGCPARSVSIAFALATPAGKEAIKKDIQAAAKGSPARTA